MLCPEFFFTKMWELRFADSRCCACGPKRRRVYSYAMLRICWSMDLLPKYLANGLRSYSFVWTWRICCHLPEPITTLFTNFANAPPKPNSYGRAVMAFDCSAATGPWCEWRLSDRDTPLYLFSCPPMLSIPFDASCWEKKKSTSSFYVSLRHCLTKMVFSSVIMVQSDDICPLLRAWSTHEWWYLFV